MGDDAKNKQTWRRFVEFTFSEEGLKRHATKPVIQILERIGHVPLAHFLLWPEMREVGADRAGVAAVAEVLRESPILQVLGGPPFYVRPSAMVGRVSCDFDVPDAEQKAKLDARLAELQGMSTSSLMKVGRKLGIDKQTLDAADDEDNPKEILVGLMMDKFCETVKGDVSKHVVMQFNVLADGLAQFRFGSRTDLPRPALAFKRRAEMLLAEVARTYPDVLCAQELNHFEDFWKERLDAMGYEGIFAPRYHESYPADFRVPPPRYRGKPSDGCAVFIRKGLLRFGTTTTKRFADLVGEKGKSQAEVVIVTTIEDEARELPLLTISVAQLAADSDIGPKASTVRKQQCRAWTTLLKKFGSKSPVVVCVDMNEDVVSDSKGGPAAFVASMGLRSAYQAAEGIELPYTCTVDSQPRCYDYILLSKGVRPTRLWKLPEESPEKILPSLVYPSHHLSLAAELEVRNDKREVVAK
eukprot:TRINITY_DN12717_c1_g1_i2.p1 TRINITY_DN12717_c1_g1~~TRINITY_DN12717_c1_g1_i2.p1  ORF type:complete len:469 (+),score=93.23 TRINITY_DN12717_c1_g1_i2:93-1499(+)